jgi:hypothetical protein
MVFETFHHEPQTPQLKSFSGLRLVTVNCAPANMARVPKQARRLTRHLNRDALLRQV